MENESIIPSPRKRKVSNPSTWKGNVIKQARVAGRSYITHKGNEVPPKHPTFTCSCKKQCLFNLGEANCIDIFSRFYNIKSKDEQDVYLQGLIDIHEVTRRTAAEREKETPRISNIFSYHVMSGTERKEVCLHAFLSVLAVSEKRIRRVRQLKVLGKTPEDKRGKGISHKLPNESYDIVNEHIISFPLKESHYSGKKTYYLSADLTVKQMYNLFRSKYPDTQVSFTSYFRYFKQNFNYRFGRPQVDTCATCEELNLKIKSPHLNIVAKTAAKAELEVHLRKSRKFYNKLKHERSEEGLQENDVLSLAFDFMKTISLPRVPVQELYYLRQLSVNVFAIHDIKNGKSKIYTYHEGVARKGPNEVCSFLLDYLSSVPQSYKKLRLFCDNCSGQNKNQVLSRFCLFLTDSKRFEEVEQFFPQRGHSFLPCDRDFGTISRKLRHHDRFFTVHQITELIITSSNTAKFEVCEVNTQDVLDFKSWHTKYYKKSCLSRETMGKNVPKDQKVHFSIHKLFHFKYSSERCGYIEAHGQINGIIPHTFYMAKTIGPINGPSSPAYPTGKVSIKKAKIDDLKKLKNYVPFEYEEFFKEILEWPTTETENYPDSDVEAE